MVAIISSNTLGFNNSNRTELGNSPNIGSQAQGRANENIAVNVSNGNLIIQQQDDRLMGIGLDLNLVRTYNSQGQLTGDSDNNDNWRIGFYKQLQLTGTLNTAGSTLTRTEGDGSRSIYTYNTTTGRYSNTDGAGTYDSIQYKVAVGTAPAYWEWADGATQHKEHYNLAGQITRSLDLDGNSLNYTYFTTGLKAGLLSEVNTTNGHGANERIILNYNDAKQLISVKSDRSNSDIVWSKTRTYYSYDSNGRLSQVKTDLSPDDNSIVDGMVYVVNYGYDSAGRINFISQGDGSALSISYDANGRVLTMVDTATGNRTLSFSYGTNTTTVTDATGGKERYTYDASSKRLRLLETLANDGVTLLQSQGYEYNLNGDVTRITDGRGNSTVFEYDAEGNQTLQRDALGNTVTQTWQAGTGRLLSRTLYTVADPDGAGSQTASGAQTQYFIYDSEGHLRYTLSPEGRVTESRYNTLGQKTQELGYRDSLYTTVHTPTTPPTETQLNTWVSGLTAAQKSQATLSDFTYDFRGNLENRKDYAQIDSNGQGILSSATQTTYVYHPHGEVLQAIQTGPTADKNRTTVYAHDGLGRLLSTRTTNGAGVVLQNTLVQYDDANRRTTHYDALTGVITQQSYNAAGELIGQVQRQGVVNASANDAFNLTQNTLFSQDFSANFNGFTVTPGVVLDGGRARFDSYNNGNPTASWPQIYQTQGVNLNANQSISSLLTTDNSGSARYFLLAVQATNGARYGIEIFGNVVHALQVSATGVLQRTVLGAIQDNTSYQFEIAGSVDGLTLSLTPVGQSRANGYIHHVAGAAHWSDAHLLAHGQQSQWVGTSKTYLDNIQVTQNTAQDNALTQTQYHYDAEGRLRAVQQYGGQTQSTQNTATVNTAHTRTSITLYDAAGRKLADIAPNGAMTEYEYNTAGQQVRSKTYHSTLTPTQLATLLNADGSPTALALSNFTSASLPRPTDLTASSQINLYDAAGRLGKTLDATGAVTEYLYDGTNQVIQTTQYANRYPASSLSALNPLANTTLASSVSVALDAAQDRMTRTFYDKDGKALGALDAEGYLTENSYNAAGQMMGSTRYATLTNSTLRASATLAQLRPAAHADDQTSRTYYDALGRTLATQNPEGIVTGYEYDTFGNLTKTTRYAVIVSAAQSSVSALLALANTNPSANLIETRSYDSAGRLLDITNSDGTVTRHLYDAAGRLVHQQVAYGTAEARSTLQAYNALGQVISTTDALGNVTRYTYDAFGRRIQSLDANNQKTYYYYDNNDQLIYSINALGEVSQSQYNALGKISQSVRYTNRLSSTQISALTGGRAQDIQTQVSALSNAALDQKVDYTYDIRGLLSTQTEKLDASSSVVSTSNTYNTFGELGTQLNPITAALRTLTTLSYNRLGQVTSTLSQGVDINNLAQANQTRTLSTRYDAFGRVIGQTDANGGISSTQYDRLGRVLKTTDALGNSQSTEYDVFDRIVTQKDKLGNTLASYSYNVTNRSMSVTDAHGNTTTTRSNRHGQSFEVMDANGTTTRTTYDLAGRATQTQVFDNLGNPIQSQGINHQSSQTYDAVGNVLTTTNALGQQVKYSYDAANRLLSTTIDPTGLNITSSTLYDGQGRKITEINAQGVETQITYNAKGQVTEIQVNPTSTDPSQKTRTTFVYNLAGQQMTVIGWQGAIAAQETTYAYDGLGRRISEQVKLSATENAITQYRYDANNNVIAKVDAHGNTTRLVYDANNQQRYSIQADGSVQETQYNANGQVLKTINYANAINLSTVTDSSTLSTIQGLVNAANPVGTVNQSLEYNYDAAGRVILTRDALGTVTQKWYDKLGNVVQQTVYATASATLSAPAVSAADQSTRMVYDKLGRMVYSIDAEGGVKQYAYNSLGQKISEKAYATLFDINAADNIADGFTGFGNKTNVAPNTDILSPVVTVNNIAGPVTVSIVDAWGSSVPAAFRIDGGEWVTSGTITNGQTIQVKVRSNSNAGGVAAAYIKIGETPMGPSGIYGGIPFGVFTAASGVSDTIFDGFTGMAGKVNVALNTDILSDVITVNNIAGAVPVNLEWTNSIAAFRIDGGAWVTSGTVTNGQTIQYKLRSSNTPGTQTAMYVKIGDTPAGQWGNGPFGVVTAASGVSDTIFDGFTGMAGKVNVALNTDILSDVITVNNIAGAVPVNLEWTNSIAAFRIDGGAWVTSGTVTNGQTIQYKLRSSNTLGTLTAMYVKIGDTPAGQWGNGPFGVVTALPRSADNIPTEAQLNTWVNNLPPKQRAQTTSLEYSYDAAGRVILTRDALGTVTQKWYDKLGNVVQQTVYATASATLSAPAVSAADQSTRMVYDKLNRMVYSIDAEGGVTENQYNALGQITKSIKYAKAVTAFNSNPAGSYYTVDGARIAINAANPVGTVNQSLEYAYDAAGRVILTRDALGTVTQKWYDKLGNVVQQTVYATASATLSAPVSSVADQSTRMVYDKLGRMVYSIDAEGGVTENQYNALGQVTKSIKYAKAVNLAGIILTPAVTQTAINAANPVGTVNQSLEYAYDAAGRVILTRDALGTVTQKWYDKLGNVVQQTVYAKTMAASFALTQANITAQGIDTVNPEDLVKPQTTRMVYDKLNRMVYSIDAEGGVTENQYNALGQITKSIKYANAVTAFNSNPAGSYYTVNGARIAINGANPVGTVNQSLEYSYDAAGRVILTRDALGTVTQKWYDKLGNVVQQTVYAKTMAASFALTQANITAQGIDTVNPEDLVKPQTTRMVYDKLNRMVYSIDAEGGVTENQYNALGQVVKSIKYANAVTAFNSNPAGSYYTVNGARIAIEAANPVADPNNKRTTLFVYDVQGRTRYQIDPLGYLKENRYNTQGQLTQSTHYAKALTSLSTLSLTEAGIASVLQSQTIVNSSLDQSTLFTYDENNRLLQVKDAEGYTESYTYDAKGNKLSYTNKLNAVWNYEYDAQNRLVKEISPSVVVSTLGVGSNDTNSTYDILIPAYSYRLETHYEYDTFGRLQKKTEAANTAQSRITRYEYDRLGQQISVIHPMLQVDTTAAAGITNNAIYNQTTLNRISTDGRTNTEGYATPTARTTYNTLGQAIANQDVMGNYSYKTYDAVGRVRFEVDAEGYVTERGYNALGQEEILTRYTQKLSLAANPAGYSTAQIQSLINATGFKQSATDRSISKQYDKVGRITLTQEGDINTYHYDGSTGYYGTKDTYTTYNAYGEAVVIKGSYKRVQTTQGQIQDQTADTYTYYDAKGQKTAVVDALGYVTTWGFDAFGNQTTQTEYAQKLTTGAWNQNSYTPNFSNAPDAGLDRSVNMTYNRLNQKTADIRVNVKIDSVNSTAGIAIRETVGINLATSYTYDAVGNRKTVTDADGNTTRTYYDALGRTVMVDAPTRTLAGETAASTPRTQLSLDAYGNVIRILQGKADAAIGIVDDYNNNRMTWMTYNSHGKQTRKLQKAGKDADGVMQQHLLTETQYDALGRATKEWIRNTDTSGLQNNFVRAFEYDKVGNQTKTHERQMEERLQALGQDLHVEDRSFTLTKQAGTKYVGLTLRDSYELLGYQHLKVVTNYSNGAELVYHLDLARSNVTNFNFLTAVHPESFPYSGNDMTSVRLYGVQPNGNERLFNQLSGLTVSYANAANVSTPRQRVMTWRRPTEGVNATIRYKLSAEAWTAARTATPTADGELWQLNMANLGLLAGQTYDFEVLYTRAGETQPYAHTVGTLSAYADGAIRSQVRTQAGTEALSQNTLSATTRLHTQEARYNAFGEIDAKRAHENTSPQNWDTTYEYDKLGRMWRTNEGGADSIKLYNNFGQETAKIEGQGDTNLRATSYSSTQAFLTLKGSLVARTAALNTEFKRTYTEYDALGRATLQQQAGFTVQNTAISTPAPKISTGLNQLTASVAGSNPATTTFAWDKDFTTLTGATELRIAYTTTSNSTVQTTASFAKSARTHSVYGSLTLKNVTLEAKINGAWVPVMGFVSTQVIDSYSNGTAVYKEVQTQLEGNGRVLLWGKPRLAAQSLLRYRSNGGAWINKTMQQDNDYRMDISAGTLPQGSYEVEVYHFAEGVSTQNLSNALSVQRGTLSVNLNSSALSLQADPAASQTQTLLPIVTQTYDRWGNTLSSTDAAGKTSNNTYNQSNQLLDTLSPEVDVWSETGVKTTQRIIQSNYYDKMGRLTAARDGNGNLTRTQYNALGQKINQYAPSQTAPLKTYTYNLFDELQTETTAVFTKNTYHYDLAGRLIANFQHKASDTSYNTGLLSLSIYGYNAKDQRIKTNQLFGGYDEITGNYIPGIDGLVTAQDYDASGRVIRTVNSKQRIEGTAWVDQGTTVRHGGFSILQNSETLTTYDANGNKVREVNANGETLRNTYDAFGRVLTHIDLSGAETTYTYNRAGQVKTQTSTRGQDLRYTYDQAGRLSAIDDWRNSYNYSTQSYRYNAAGQQIVEQYTQRNSAGASQSYSALTLYDAAGRIASVTDQDGSTLRYRYDANNNRRAILIDYRDFDETAWFKDGNINNRTYSNIDQTRLGTPSYKYAENWYTYDSANRVLISQGNLVNGQITIGQDALGENKGSITTYDSYGLGRRLSTQTHHGGTQTYTYDNAGRLLGTYKDGKAVSRNVYDLLGRMLTQRSYNANGDIERTHGFAYNILGHQTDQYTLNASNQLVAKVSIQYDAEGNNLSHLQHGFDENSGLINTASYYRHEYTKYDGYKEHRTTVSTMWYNATPGSHNPNIHPITWGQTRYSLDNTGNTLAVSVHEDLNKAQALVVDTMGKIRQKIAGVDIAANYQGEIQDKLAQVNAMLDFAFQPATSGHTGQSSDPYLKADTRLRAQKFLYAPNNSPIADYGRIDTEANFDYNYQSPEDSTGNTQGQYIINLGDSLRSIAQQVYGDASLWYLIADANSLIGVDPNQSAAAGGVLTDANGATVAVTLSPGQMLKIPNAINGLPNTSSTFKPYNPASIIGDTSPTIPSPPPPKQCGKIGQIIMIIVAIVVTVLLAIYLPEASGWFATAAKAFIIGVTASFASQAVGVMIGAIDQINWKQVAIAGVAAGVTAGVGNLGNAWVFGSTTATAMANAAISSALTQGINIMTGQQQRFNWRSVATAAVAAGAMDAIGLDGNKVGKEAKDGNGNLVFDEAGKQVFSSSVTNWGERAVYWFGSSFVNTASEYLVNRISNAPDDQRRNFGRSWGNGIVSAASADIAHSIGDAYAADKKYINPNDPNDQGYHTAGGILKHYLSHALLGGARAALMGDSFGSGALGGLTQAVIGDLVPDEFVKGTGGIGVNADGKRDTSGDWVDRFLRQSSSTVVGLSASWLAEEVGGDGAAAQGAAQNGWENNFLEDHQAASYEKRYLAIRANKKLSLAQINQQLDLLKKEAIRVSLDNSIEASQDMTDQSALSQMVGKAENDVAEYIKEADEGYSRLLFGDKGFRAWAKEPSVAYDGLSLASVQKNFLNSARELRAAYFNVKMATLEGGGTTATAVPFVGEAEAVQILRMGRDINGEQTSRWWGAFGVVTFGYGQKFRLGGKLANEAAPSVGRAASKEMQAAEKILENAAPAANKTTRVLIEGFKEVAVVKGTRISKKGKTVNTYTTTAADGKLITADSLRVLFLGATPSKTSKVGEQVIARMEKQGKIIRNRMGAVTHFIDSEGVKRPFDKADMSHIQDAVTWWKNIGRQTGARSAEVKKFMNDANNYVLDYRGYNRSAGAILGKTEKYLAPLLKYFYYK